LETPLSLATKQFQLAVRPRKAGVGEIVELPSLLGLLNDKYDADILSDYYLLWVGLRVKLQVG